MGKEIPAELSREMLLFHRLYNEKVSRRFRALHVEELSQVEYLVMSVIVERGPITVKEVCERTMMVKQQTNKNLNQLEEMGLIVRQRAPHDRRTVLVEATDRAREIQHHMLHAAEEELSRIFGQLTPEDAQDYLEAIRCINGILEKFPVGK